MPHYKRKRPKNRRAGCLLCKPHKANGCRHESAGNRRKAQGSAEQLDALTRDTRESMIAGMERP